MSEAAEKYYQARIQQCLEHHYLTDTLPTLPPHPVWAAPLMLAQGVQATLLERIDRAGDIWLRGKSLASAPYLILWDPGAQAAYIFRRPQTLGETSSRVGPIPMQPDPEMTTYPSGIGAFERSVAQLGALIEQKKLG